MFKRFLRVTGLLAAMFFMALSGVQALTQYDDTGAEGPDVDGTPGDFIVCNGDFAPDRFTGPDGAPECWDLHSADQAAWEKRFADMNMAIVGDTAHNPGMNRALGMFVRNVGGSGPAYLYATQSLDGITAPGNYWVQVHATMFAEYDFIPFSSNVVGVFDPIIANSVAWYAISDAADPNMVASSEWREMFINQFGGLDVPGTLACPNVLEFCAQMGRYETVSINPGQYLHLKAGHKFDTFNVWTVFEWDDISIVPIDVDYTGDDLSGFYAIGELAWDRYAPR